MNLFCRLGIHFWTSKPYYYPAKPRRASLARDIWVSLLRLFGLTKGHNNCFLCEVRIQKYGCDCSYCRQKYEKSL